MLCNSNSYNSFLIKYNAFGNILWARGIGSGLNYSIISNDVGIDASGNPYIAGNFTGSSLIIGNDSLSVSWYTGFMAKYTGAGKASWARNLNTNAVGLTTSANHLTTDANNQIYVGGSFINQVNGLPFPIFGSDTLYNANAGGTEAIYVAKYDSSGKALWGKTAYGVDWNAASEITIDKYGNIFMVGCYESPNCIFGADTLHNLNAASPTYNSRASNYFIAKIGSAGVGIEKYNQNTNINIYPNPSSGNINISSTSNIDELKVSNMLGQVIYQTMPQTSNISLSIGNAGVYFINITSDKETTIKKVVINK